MTRTFAPPNCPAAALASPTRNAPRTFARTNNATSPSRPCVPVRPGDGLADLECLEYRASELEPAVAAINPSIPHVAYIIVDIIQHIPIPFLAPPLEFGHERPRIWPFELVIVWQRTTYGPIALLLLVHTNVVPAIPWSSVKDRDIWPTSDRMIWSTPPSAPGTPHWSTPRTRVRIGSSDPPSLLMPRASPWFSGCGRTRLRSRSPADGAAADPSRRRPAARH